MKIIVKGSFDRDIDNIRDKDLRAALKSKIAQIERAKDISQITGLKLMRGYTHHYRIKIEAGKYLYRLGVVIRGDKIWFNRFLPRKIIYLRYP